MRAVLLFALVALSASAQINLAVFTNRLEVISNASPETAQTQTNQNQSLVTAQRIEKIRDDCIQNRRHICGKILKVLPGGIVVDSGYTNLMREPLNRSWLVPGTAVATRATHLIEGNQPDSVCIGRVFLTDLPQTPGVKPKVYDYVNLEAFPAGQYTYTSVGNLRRTVRKFSTKLVKAVQWKLEESEKQNAQTK